MIFSRNAFNLAHVFLFCLCQRMNRPWNNEQSGRLILDLVHSFIFNQKTLHFTFDLIWEVTEIWCLRESCYSSNLQKMSNPNLSCCLKISKLCWNSRTWLESMNHLFPKQNLWNMIHGVTGIDPTLEKFSECVKNRQFLHTIMADTLNPLLMWERSRKFGFFTWMRFFIQMPVSWQTTTILVPKLKAFISIAEWCNMKLFLTFIIWNLEYLIFITF